MRNALLTTIAVLVLAACSKDDTSGGAASASASAATAPPASSPAGSPSAAPAAAASSASEPQHDCPPGSTGVGSFTKPCEAKGGSRMMDVKWTKTGDSGPSFAITNKSQLVIVYGRIAVYFYDKAGKQLDVKDDSGKTHPYHTCAGNFFGGVMNPAEREVLNFSCVPKTVVPDGTAKVEGEMQIVGFADSTGKKIDFYWRNNDLVPDVRPKGGVK
jgi:hypothetical protein